MRVLKYDHYITCVYEEAQITLFDGLSAPELCSVPDIIILTEFPEELTKVTYFPNAKS